MHANNSDAIELSTQDIYSVGVKAVNTFGGFFIKVMNWKRKIT